jgi:hypothetical protein
VADAKNKVERRWPPEKPCRFDDRRDCRDAKVIDHCAARNLKADVEPVRADQINDAIDRVVKKDVRYRRIIDLGP